MENDEALRALRIVDTIISNDVTDIVYNLFLNKILELTLIPSLDLFWYFLTWIITWTNMR